MKRVLVLLGILIEGMMTGVMIGLLLPAEQRLKLSRQLACVIGGMEEHMPEG